ncbi:MAG: hypothetical protein ACTHLH_00825 [Solirubrobacterales bacterium]
MSSLAERVLTGSRPEGVASATEKIAGEEIAEIEAALPKALAGDRDQVRIYFDAFTHMARHVLMAISSVRPNLLILTAEQHRALDASPTVPPWAKAVLEGEAMRAPFSDWVGALGPGKGTALALVSSLRQTLPDTEPLKAPARRRLPDWDLEDRDVVRFYRAVAEFLEMTELPLERIRRVLDLNRTELAALFGVTRQAVERWEAQGVPADRAAKLSTINAIVDLLEAQLKRDRIPAVVRRSAPAYGERSVLEAISAGEEGLALMELRDAFNWASAA